MIWLLKMSPDIDLVRPHQLSYFLEQLLDNYRFDIELKLDNIQF